MIQKFASSLVLTPLTLNKPHKYLRSQRRTKSLLLSWKFQKTLTKMMANERRLKLLKARIKARIRRKILLIPQRKPQILLPLSSAKLLSQWSPIQKLRLVDFYYFYMFFFEGMYHTFFFILLMKIFFFCFIHLHNVCYEIHCQSMMIFCHWNKIHYRIL